MNINKIFLFALFFLFFAAFPISADASSTKCLGMMCNDGQMAFEDVHGVCQCAANITGKEGTNRGCMHLNDRLRETRKCLFCPLFKVLYGAAQQMARISFEKTAIPIRTVMLVGFALYIAFSVLGYVSTLTKADASKYLTGLLTMSFKVLIAYLLLTNGEEIYTYFLNPVLSAGLDFGGAMLFSNGGSSMAECKANSSGSLVGIFPDGLYDDLECFIKGVQDEIAFAQAAGSALVCFGRKEASSWAGIWDFSMVIQGAIIYLCALLLSFAFAFYLIDSVVQLGIVGALMAFLIGCWPFKMTSGYTKKGLDMFLNTFFVFVFMGIVVSINIKLIGESLTTGGLDTIADALNNDKIDELKTIMDWTFGSFLILICCCIFGFKFCAQAAALAGQMAGGGGAQIGQNIGGMVASPVVKGAKKIGGAAIAPITAAGARVLSKAYNETKDAFVNPYRAGQKLAGSFFKSQGRLNQAAGKAKFMAGSALGRVGAGGADLREAGLAQMQHGAIQKAAGQSVIDKANEGAGKSWEDKENSADNTAQNPSSIATPPSTEQEKQVEELLKKQQEELQKQLDEQLQKQQQESQQQIDNSRQDLENRIDQQTHQSGTGTPGAGGNPTPAGVHSDGGGQPAPAENQQSAEHYAQASRQAYEQHKKAYAEANANYDQLTKQMVELKQQIDVAQEALKHARGTPQEAQAAQAAAQLMDKYKALQTSGQSMKDTLTQRQKQMDQSAVLYDLNRRKAEAFASGNVQSFNDSAEQSRSRNNLNKIKEQLDNIINAGPRN